MSDILNFINKIKQNPEKISFQDTIAVIDSGYNFTPTAFKTEINLTMQTKIMVLARFSLSPK